MDLLRQVFAEVDHLAAKAPSSTASSERRAANPQGQVVQGMDQTGLQIVPAGSW
jgi:hypothetical protein